MWSAGIEVDTGNAQLSKAEGLTVTVLQDDCRSTTCPDYSESGDLVEEPGLGPACFGMGSDGRASLVCRRQANSNHRTLAPQSTHNYIAASNKGVFLYYFDVSMRPSIMPLCRESKVRFHGVARLAFTGPDDWGAWCFDVYSDCSAPSNDGRSDHSQRFRHSLSR